MVEEIKGHTHTHPCEANTQKQYHTALQATNIYRQIHKSIRIKYAHALCTHTVRNIQEGRENWRLFFSWGSGKAEKVPLCYTVTVLKMHLKIRKSTVYISGNKQTNQPQKPPTLLRNHKCLPKTKTDDNCTCWG